MSNVSLASLFDLESIEAHLFRGDSWDLGYPSLYGGQVLGQSVMAAHLTVDRLFNLHSFHSYFLLPGDAGSPVIYDVEHVRDGRSFCTRRIKAIQNGRTIFYMTASFQITEEGQLEHQFAEKPLVPEPDLLTPDIEIYLQNLPNISSRIQRAVEYHRPVDIRSINLEKALNTEKSDPVRHMWFKSRDELPDNLAINQAGLAYASDYNFLTTALFAHGVTPSDKAMRIATIDHAMWFHKPFRFDEWLMYTNQSPFSGNSRAMVEGKIFNLQGELVASSMQEGLFRKVELE